MYLTKQQLQNIIQEEIGKLSEEQHGGAAGSTRIFQQTRTGPEGVTKGVEVTDIRGEGASEREGQTTGATTHAVGAGTKISPQAIATHQSKTQPISLTGQLTADEQDLTQQRTTFTLDPKGGDTSTTEVSRHKGLPAAGLNIPTAIGESFLHQIIQEELEAVLTGKIKNLGR